MSAAGDSVVSGETLASQYADLRDEESVDNLDLITEEPVVNLDLLTAEPVVNLDLITAAPPSEGGGPPHAQVDVEAMEEDSVLDGTWFKSNGRSLLGKRLRDLDTSDFELNLTADSVKKPKPLLTPCPPVVPRKFPTNKTLQSENSPSVVLIAQLDHDVSGFFGASNKKLSMNPLAVSRGLKSLVNFESVKDVRINRSRNLVAVEFQSAADPGAAKLLQSSVLGQYAVRCYRPAASTKAVCWGVIRPISLDEDLEALPASLACDGVTVDRVIRLHRYVGGSREPSTSVKIAFVGSTLPRCVFYDFIRLPVRPFEESPLRCFRCQRHGHLAGGCVAPPRCLVCGGGHYKDTCPSAAPHCANCGGPHIASSRACPLVQQATDIQRLRGTGLSFVEARNQVSKTSRTSVAPSTLNEPQYLDHLPPPLLSASASPSYAACTASQQSSSLLGSQQLPSSEQSCHLRVESVPVEVHQTQGSYYIPRRYPLQPARSYSETLHCPPSQDSSAAFSQLPQEDSVLQKCRLLVESSMASLFAKLGSFLVELFSTNLSIENKRERDLLLIGMVRNHFGASVGQSLLETFHRSSGSATAPPSCGGAVPDPPPAPTLPSKLPVSQKKLSKSKEKVSTAPPLRASARSASNKKK